MLLTLIDRLFGVCFHTSGTPIEKFFYNSELFTTLILKVNVTASIKSIAGHELPGNELLFANPGYCRLCVLLVILLRSKMVISFQVKFLCYSIMLYTLLKLVLCVDKKNVAPT